MKCAQNCKETEVDNTKSTPTLSLCTLKVFPVNTLQAGRVTGSFITNCQKLILKAQLISRGCAWFQNQCFMGVKSDEICLRGFDPDAPF